MSLENVPWIQYPSLKNVYLAGLFESRLTLTKRYLKWYFFLYKNVLHFLYLV